MAPASMDTPHAFPGEHPAAPARALPTAAIGAWVLSGPEGAGPERLFAAAQALRGAGLAEIARGLEHHRMQADP